MNIKSKVVIASIISLGAITGGIILSKNGNIEEGKRETVIIEEGYGSNKNSDKNTGEIKVAKIEKVLGKSIGWLDDDNILMFYPSSKKDSIKKCYFKTYNMTTEKEEFIYEPKVEGRGAILSPDKNKIFITQLIPKDIKIGEWVEEDYSNHIYDMKNDTLTKIESDAGFNKWCVDGSIVKLTKEKSFKEDENSSRYKIVQNEFYDVNEKISKSIKNEDINIDNKRNEFGYEISLVKDMENYFVDANDKSGISVFKIDNKKKEHTTKLFNGYIRNSKFIDDNKILFNGNYKGNDEVCRDGVFIYDIESNEVVNLISEFYPSMKVSDNNRYIAFCNKDFNELYVARLEDNKIKEKTLVLKKDIMSNGIFFSPDGKKLIVRVWHDYFKSYVIYLED